MTTGIMLVLSGILIGAGFALVWRDIRRNRRQAFLSYHDSHSVAEADVEITVARPEKMAAPKIRAKALTSALGASWLFGRKGGDQTAEQSGEHKEKAQQAVVAEWDGLQPVIEAGIAKINSVLGEAGITIGLPGETAWSYKNHGYGVYRRILIADESTAWLRLELAPDEILHARVKAHKDEHSEINHAGETAAKALDAARVSDLLADCLKPLAAYLAKTQGVAVPAQEANAKGWEEIDTIASAALTATNGALSQAGARLVPLDAPTWHAEAKGHRMPLAIEVYGKNVARMHIDYRGDELEVSVGVPDALFVNLARRRRIPTAGLSIHALAELIADCAWPVIARSREGRRSA
jgi:hypothetical protein